MADYKYPKKKKRYKIKYKNLAILLAILLLIILLISKGCSAIFGNRDKKDGAVTTPASGDISTPDIPDDALTAPVDPTDQHAYQFTSISVTDADLGSGNLVLVNNNIKFLGTVTDDDLDVVRERKNGAYSVKDYNVKLKPVAMDALNSMMLDFYTVTGKDTVMVNSGFRTVEYQEELYQEELESTGQDSSTLVAKGGYSEHHTGLVVDFTVSEDGHYDQSLIGTGDYKWINDNCYKYGYVNRYPAGKESLTLIDNEPWHFRYVGVPHATVMHNYDYCLEEYISFVKNYTISSGFLSVTTDDGSRYMIYYTPSNGADGTTIFIPVIPDGDGDDSNNQPYPYEISGNNVDGWIVTFLYEKGTGSISPLPEGTPDNTVDADNTGDGGEEDQDTQE